MSPAAELPASQPMEAIVTETEPMSASPEKPKHTPGPWHVGAQNDALYVIAGRAPALSNDCPWHDAPRVALARVFDAGSTDALPVDASANARLIAASPGLLTALQSTLALARLHATSTDDVAVAVFAKAEAAIRLALTGER